LGAAREMVRVAHALAALPRIGAAMACGRLSYSKVRALTRVATAATEEYFLSIALHGTAQHVEHLARAYRDAQQAAALSREARQQALREVTWWRDEDGSLMLKARLPALAGALLLKALDAAAAQLPEGDPADATPAAVPPGHRPAAVSCRRADALLLLAEGFLAGGASPAQRGRPLRTADRYQVVVHVAAETLQGGSDGRCEIEGGGALPAASARRLACDAGIVKISETARGEPLDIGRKTRAIPAALRRALAARDRGCRFPGCTHQRYLDAHHIRHWADGGATKASNLITLCRFHHRLVHEGGIVIQTLDDGALRYLRPDGRPYEPYPPPDEPGLDESPLDDSPRGEAALIAEHAACGLDIDAHTATPLWQGERMDYGLAVQGLMDCEERSRGNAPPPG
jgi:hypothetical protein